jgi:hypothetical protein
MKISKPDAMKPSPEKLEQVIHQTLRSLPAHRAPRSLEARVLAAIEARASLPWWRQSFSRWPMPARVAFVLSSAGIAKLLLMVVVWVMAGFDGAQLSSAFSSQLSWIESVTAVVHATGDFFAALYRGIPVLWLYGAVAFVGAAYAALFGLGAAAYRALHARR